MSAALDWYVREWGAVPQMPSSSAWQRVMDDMHRRAAEAFGEAAAKEAWEQFARNRARNNGRPCP
jgi:hypothetical protein